MVELNPDLLPIEEEEDRYQYAIDAYCVRCKRSPTIICPHDCCPLHYYSPRNEENIPEDD